MFGMNSLGAGGPSSLAELLALASLTSGGGANPPLPVNPAAGGQNLPAPPDGVGAPRPGMFGAGSGQAVPAMLPQQRPSGMVPNADGTLSRPDADSFGFQNQGPLMPDQFSMGRDLARASEVPHISAKPYKGLFPGKDAPKIALILSAAANGFLAGGGNPAGQAGLNSLYAMMQRDRDHKARLAEHESELKARRFEPQQVGRSIVQLGDQGYQTLYTAPDDPHPFEAYAAAQGLEPGSPEYIQAVRDYRLGAWSDPAVEAKERMEGVRYGYRDALQDDRLDTSRRNTDVRVGATRRGQDIRSGDARRGQDLNDTRGRRGQDLNDKRVRESAGFRGRGGKGPSASSDLIGPVHVDKSGKRIQYSKSKRDYVEVP